VTILIERMREELVRRNYAATTIHSYLKAVEHFRTHVDTPIDEVGPDDIVSFRWPCVTRRGRSWYRQSCARAGARRTGDGQSDA
jgi:Phage integrase, N-terminal SAM-like domain